jgi:predicted glutamine amidotransferase
MCIIVAKQKEVKLPDTKILETCFKQNSDGAGFMYVKGGKVVIDKGYMDYKSFKKHYDKLCRKYHNFENKSLVIHFRIGTDGSNIAKNTHPYPICSDYNIMNKTFYKCDLAMVHNGIITDYRPKATDGDIVDTMKFIKDFIQPLKQGWSDFYKNDNMLKGLEYLTNSKLCFLDNKDNIYTSGYFINDNGILYSNGTYKTYTYQSKYVSKYTPYYNDYDYDIPSEGKVWHYTYKKDGTKETKTEPKNDNLKKFDLDFKVLGKNDVLITEDGRRYEINIDNTYYYDNFTNIVYRKQKDGAYKQIFKNCMIQGGAK